MGLRAPFEANAHDHQGKVKSNRIFTGHRENLQQAEYWLEGMSPLWECHCHCGNFSVVPKGLEGCQKAPLRLLGKHQHVLHSHRWCQESGYWDWTESLGKGERIVLISFISLLHTGNFCPFPHTIFIIYLKHTRLQGDAFGFFPHWKLLLWPTGTNRTLVMTDRYSVRNTEQMQGWISRWSPHSRS